MNFESGSVVVHEWYWLNRPVLRNIRGNSLQYLFLWILAKLSSDLFTINQSPRRDILTTRGRDEAKQVTPEW